MAKKILITGGSGFIGRNLVPYLKKNGYRIAILSKSAGGDILKAVDIKRALAGCQAVVHLAVVKNGNDAYQVNIGGARNLIECCKTSGVKRIINVSSQSTKIKVKGSYAESKFQADSIFAKSGLEVTTLLISVICSLDEASLFGQITRYIKKLPFVPVMGSGNWKSNPIYITDLCEVILRSLNNKDTIGKTYDVGGPESISFNKLIDKIQKYTGAFKPVLHIPFQLSVLFARLAELVFPNPPITLNNVLGSNQNTNSKPSKLFSDIKFIPMSLDGSLQHVFNPENKVRVGVVGFGKMGMVHSALLSANNDVSLVAICDTDRSLKNTCKSLGLPARFYFNLDQMIDKEILDAVYVCTPTFTHFDIAKKVLKNNLHLFVEKPTCENYEKSKKLLEYLEKNPELITSVGYFYLYRQPYMKLGEVIKSGILGNNLRLIITLKHAEVLKYKKGWLFTKKMSGGGVVINPTSHIIAWLVYYLGKPVRVESKLKSIYSKEVEDVAKINFTFERAEAQITASWSVPDSPVLKAEVLAEGSKRKVVLKNGIFAHHADVINLDPGAGGEGYFFESKEFIDAIRNHGKTKFSLRESLVVDEAINKVYANP